MYAIRDLISLGFWDESEEKFRGYLFATKYSSFNNAEDVARKISGNVEIIKIY